MPLRGAVAGGHLVVDVSAHGFGHIAMTAPVVNRLRQLRPDLRVTVRSAASRHKLEEHFRGRFDHIPKALDLGMAMHDALSVNRDASYAYYSELHGRWSDVLAEAESALSALSPTALLSNIPYVPIAAAARLGVPAAALCCLHWADIFRHYCRDRVDASVIEGQIREAYAAAAVFLAPAPSMPVHDLGNVVAIGPIARTGVDRASWIRDRLGLGSDVRLALLSLGGFAVDLDVSRWPALPGWCVIAGMPIRGEHPNVVAAERIDLPYVDVFASVDAVITKLGYGTVAEAAVNGKPVLYVPRDDWPEQVWLARWLGEHGRCMECPLEALVSGNLSWWLTPLIGRATPPRPAATGIDEAARALDALLSGEATRASPY